VKAGLEKAFPLNGGFLDLLSRPTCDLSGFRHVVSTSTGLDEIYDPGLRKRSFECSSVADGQVSQQSETGSDEKLRSLRLRGVDESQESEDRVYVSLKKVGCKGRMEKKKRE